MTTPRWGGGVRFYYRYEGEYSQKHLRVQTELDEEQRGKEGGGKRG